MNSQADNSLMSAEITHSWWARLRPTSEINFWPRLQSGVPWNWAHFGLVVVELAAAPIILVCQLMRIRNVLSYLLTFKYQSVLNILSTILLYFLGLWSTLLGLNVQMDIVCQQMTVSLYMKSIQQTFVQYLLSTEGALLSLEAERDTDEP